jgi:uncharacterized membrane protein YoaK (UPF0700 family)
MVNWAICFNMITNSQWHNFNRSARFLLARRRTATSDAALATILAGIAGAVNAGGFFVVGQYTSHMTGYLSQIADHLVLRNFVFAAFSAGAVLAFLFGAGLSSFLINWARQSKHHQQYAWAIAAQGLALLCLSLLNYSWASMWNSITLYGLCAIMGLQNATITKISGARIRTTHATGMVTDIGIEIGRASYGAFSPRAGVKADRRKLTMLLALVATYVGGGIIGAIGYSSVGMMFSLPLAAALLVLSYSTLKQR